MAKRQIRLYDLNVDPDELMPPTTISGDELAARATLGVLDEATVILLPKSASVVLATADDDSSLLRLIPGVRKENDKERLYWLRVRSIPNSNKSATLQQKPGPPRRSFSMAARKSGKIAQLQRSSKTSRRKTTAVKANGAMTDAQQSQIRIHLARRNLKGEKATRYMKRFFEVKHVNDISETDADKLIKLLTEGGES